MSLIDGLQTMETESARISPTAPLPQQYAGLLASVRLESGQAAQALETLDTLLSTVTEAGLGFYLPEIHRLRGECLMRLDAGHSGEAMREFEAAVASAKQQQAHVFQLRAAISLARAWDAMGTPEKGPALLHEALGVFGTDDDAPELATARQILSTR